VGENDVMRNVMVCMIKSKSIGEVRRAAYMGKVGKLKKIVLVKPREETKWGDLGGDGGIY
jgi:hypothetical protein